MGQLAYQLAYDAIDEFVVEQDLAPSGTWRQIVPGEDWGFTTDGWEAAASDIVNRFNDRLPDDMDIEVPISAKRNSNSKKLVDFQRYLAAKAEQLGVAPVVAEMEH